MPRALFALSVGAFGLGTTEFVVMGMLPEIATGLGVSVPAVGLLISAYAVGVVVGAPTLTAIGVRFSPRQCLVGLMVLFTVGNAAAALAPGYEWLVAARVLTALSHGAFFGVGAVAARSLVAPDRATSAIAQMMVGLTLANVVGVPLGTFLAQQASWRLVFGVVAGLGLLTIAGLLAWLPADVGGRGDLRAEVAAFRKPRVWLVLGLTMVGFAALFAVYSYVSPILTELGGLSEGWVTPVLALFGIGTTVGTLLGGRLGDRFGFRLVAAGMVASALLLAAFAFLATVPVAAVVILVLFGTVAFAMGPTVQNGVIEAADIDGGSLVSAANQGAFNVANALGAALGALVLSAGLGYTAPMWVGAALAATGATIATVASRYDVPRPAVPVVPRHPGAVDRLPDAA